MICFCSKLVYFSCSEQISTKLTTCFLRLNARKYMLSFFSQHFFILTLVTDWCLYRHQSDLPDRFGKIDLWIANLISVNRNRRNVTRRNVTDTSRLFDYPFNFNLHYIHTFHFWIILQKANTPHNTSFWL